MLKVAIGRMKDRQLGGGREKNGQLEFLSWKWTLVLGKCAIFCRTQNCSLERGLFSVIYNNSRILVKCWNNFPKNEQFGKYENSLGLSWQPKELTAPGLPWHLNGILQASKLLATLPWGRGLSSHSSCE